MSFAIKHIDVYISYLFSLFILTALIKIAVSIKYKGEVVRIFSFDQEIFFTYIFQFIFCLLWTFYVYNYSIVDTAEITAITQVTTYYTAIMSYTHYIRTKDRKMTAVTEADKRLSSIVEVFYIGGWIIVIVTMIMGLNNIFINLIYLAITSCLSIWGLKELKKIKNEYKTH
jgi:hypothetical protein